MTASTTKLSLDDVLAMLHGVTRCADGSATARCPAHDDRRASLSITTGDDGRVLLHCHAGCGFEQLTTALGIAPVQLMPIGEHQLAGGKPRSRIVATYQYRDESGTLLYQVVRMEPKDFRQRKPDGNGGWNWSIKGVRRVPYRLREVLAEKAKPVLIVEGEKDADNLASIGLLATTSSAGAGKWPKEADFNEPFRGRDVVVIPDNDEPGRAHAESVARILHPIAARVRVCMLPNLPAKGDVSDWIDSHGDAAEPDVIANELLSLIDAAPDFDPSVPGENSPPKPDSTRTREITFRWIHEETRAALDAIAEGGVPLLSTGLDELDYALEGGIAPSEMWIVGGRPGHGKTALVGQALDRHTGDGRPTLFVCRDMPTSIFCQRNLQFISAIPKPRWREQIVELRQDVEAHYFGRAPGLIVDDLAHVEDVAEAIRLAVKEHGVQFVAIDYLQLLDSKGRDSYERISAASRAIREVTTQSKVVTMALCQLNREFEGRSPAIPRLSDLRGSGTLEADADVVTFIVRPHLLDSDQDPSEIQVFVCKNRSRATRKHVAVCRFDAERMRIVDQVESQEPDYSKGWR